MKVPSMKPDAVEKWTAIIEAARRHPHGVKVYCEENNISHSFYYVQFQKLKPFHPEWSIPVSRGSRKQKIAEQTPRTKFVPVKVATERPAAPQRLTVEIRVPGRALITLPEGMSPTQLAEFVMGIGGEVC